MRAPALWIAVLVLAAAAAWPATTSAHRAPTSAEKDAIVSDLGFTFTQPSCLGVSISTINERWASVWFKPPRHGESINHYVDRCDPADGVTVAKRTNGTWRQVTAGSDIEACPPNVPVRIGRDLRWRSRPFCRAPRTIILCDARDSIGSMPATKPRRCGTSSIARSLAEAPNLRKLRWRRWGHRAARARGVDIGWHSPHPQIAVKVRAYRKRRGCRYDFIYTRMRVISRYGSTLVNYPRC